MMGLVETGRTAFRKGNAMNLDELVEYANVVAEKAFHRSGAAIPMYFLVDADGKPFMVPGPHNKDAAVMLEFMKLRRIVRYVSTDEVWTVHLNGTEAETAKMAEDINNMGGAENHPDRVKVLLLVAVDNREGYRIYHRDIIRDPGKRARLGSLVRDEDTQLEGGFVGMLPRVQ